MNSVRQDVVPVARGGKGRVFMLPEMASMRGSEAYLVGMALRRKP